MLINLSAIWGGALLAIVCVAAVIDFKTLKIPHIFPGLVIVLWLAALPVALTSFLAPFDILWFLLSAAFAFLVGFILFAIKVMGGGDVKLFAALALWFTPMSLMQLTLLMFTLGLFYTLGYAAWNYTSRRKKLSRGGETRRESYLHVKRSKFPYGPAIALGLGAYLALFSA